MSATISASVKFCPEIVTVPLPEDVVGVLVSPVAVLLEPLPQPARTTAALTVAAAPARIRRECMDLTFCVPRPWARVSGAPKCCQGRTAIIPQRRLGCERLSAWWYPVRPGVPDRPLVRPPPRASPGGTPPARRRWPRRSP